MSESVFFAETHPVLWILQLFSKLHARIKRIKDKEDNPLPADKTYVLFSFLYVVFNNTIEHKPLYTLYNKYIITTHEVRKHTSKNIMYLNGEWRDVLEQWALVFDSEILKLHAAFELDYDSAGYLCLSAFCLALKHKWQFAT